METQKPVSEHAQDEVLVEWNPSMMLEVTLLQPDDFLKVKETLTRIGIATADNRLFQSCYLLHKAGHYFIMHFKELFLLDGRASTLSENDLARRNTIATLLSDWGLLTLVNPAQTFTKADMRQIKVIPHKDKHLWQLIPKYAVGKYKSAVTAL